MQAGSNIKLASHAMKLLFYILVVAVLYLSGGGDQAMAAAGRIPHCTQY
jgi:hypothetical protein